MKKTVGFRFATGTLEKLDRLSEGSTRTAVLERLIEEAWVPSDKPPKTRHEAATIVDKAVKRLEAEKVQRQTTTLTGRPHGPVPKGAK